MDEDTIFPALSVGEQIIDKYRHIECCNSIETIVILTNIRLLIRWKEQIFCCFHQSLYSAIELNSIQRIDETRLSMKALFSLIILAFISFILMIIGYAGHNAAWGTTTLFVFLGIIAYGVYYYFTLQWRYITLKGHFGSQTLKFEVGVARQFEARLSEMMHQTGKQQQLPQTSVLMPSNFA